MPARGRIGRAALDYHHAGSFQAFEQLIRVFAFPVSIASVCLHSQAVRQAPEQKTGTARGDGTR